MSFDKEQYWNDKPNNIGSKRPKSFRPNFSKFSGINRAKKRSKRPDICNDKKHRDAYTIARKKQLDEDRLKG